MKHLIKALAGLLAGLLAAALLASLFAAGLPAGYGIGYIIVFLLLVLLASSLFSYGEFRRYRQSSKAGMEVVLDRGWYLPGDAVNVAVRILGRKDFAVGGARAALVREVHYTYRAYSGNGEDVTSVRKTGTDEVVVAEERFMGEGRILAGQSWEYRIPFPLPPDAPPTAKGRISGVSWKAKIALDVPRGVDLDAEVPVVVLSTAASSCASRAEAGPECEPQGACGMRFRLPTRSFGAGERVEGALVVVPQEDGEVRALRVELVRHEALLRKGDVSERVEAGETLAEGLRFRPEVSQEHRFALTVPEDLACPCHETEHTRVSWRLRAVADRGRRPDLVLTQELNVYGGPVRQGIGARDAGARGSR